MYLEHFWECPSDPEKLFGRSGGHPGAAWHQDLEQQIHSLGPHFEALVQQCVGFWLQACFLYKSYIC